MYMYINTTGSSFQVPNSFHDLLNKMNLRSDKEVELIKILVLFCELWSGQTHHLVHPQLLQEEYVSYKTNLTYEVLIPNNHLVTYQHTEISLAQGVYN